MTIFRGGGMTLFSTSFEVYSQRVRFVLAEKGVHFNHVETKSGTLPEELRELTPHHCIPTLVDRDLVLYDSKVIMEYLDERFPHPPLLPIYPVGRAKSRLMIFRIEQDWYRLVEQIQTADHQQAAHAKEALVTSLVNMLPAFKEFPYFLSEEFTLVDCTLVPLLWQITHLEIELPGQADPLWNYAQRLFERESFQNCLTETEQEVHNEENVI